MRRLPPPEHLKTAITERWLKSIGRLVEKHPELLEAAVPHYSDGFTPLMYAIVRRVPESVEALLEVGADVLAVDDGGYTTLHYAAQENEVGIAEMILDRAPQLLNQINKQKDKPLDLALLYDCFDCARFLVERGAVAVKKENRDKLKRL